MPLTKKYFLFDVLSLNVDLRIESYKGPEAFQVKGPGKLMLVWGAGDEAK